MKLRYIGIFLVVASLAVVGCKKKQPTPNTTKNQVRQTKSSKKSTKPSATDMAAIKRAKAVMKAAFVTLSGKLRAAIKKGGVPAAVNTCAKVAGPTTSEVAKKHKVKLARVSHKPRNPKNQANASEMKMILAYIADIKAGKSLKPIVVTTKKTQTVYAPIRMIMPVCLKCHGEVGKQVNTKHYEVIKKHFPNDKAVNFKMAELRGLWKVTLQ